MDYWLDEGGHVHGPQGYTGHVLTTSLFPGEEAITDDGTVRICDLNGDTGYYILEFHIYGPDSQLPW